MDRIVFNSTLIIFLIIFNFSIFYNVDIFQIAEASLCSEGCGKQILGGKRSDQVEDALKEMDPTNPGSVANAFIKDPKNVVIALDPVNYAVATQVLGMPDNPKEWPKWVEEEAKKAAQNIIDQAKVCNVSIPKNSEEAKNEAIDCAIKIATSNVATNRAISVATPYLEKFTPNVDVLDTCNILKFDKLGIPCDKLQEGREQLKKWWASYYSQFNCGLTPVEFTESVKTLKEIQSNYNSHLKQMQCATPGNIAEKFSNDVVGKLIDEVKR